MTNLHDDDVDQCTSKEPEEPVPEDKHSKALKKKGGRPRKEDLMQVRHSKLVYGEIPDDSEELSLEAKLKRDKRRRDNLLAAARYRHKKDERINELRKGNEQLTRRLKALSAIIRELRHEIARVESIYKRVAEENIDVRTELDKVTQSELNCSERMPDEMDTEQSSSSTPPQTAQPSHESMSPSGSTPMERCDKPAKGVVVIPATAVMRNFLLQNPSRSILQ
ncbi:unnamed protein product, partial [Anisakis simplex]|uniref:BZIP domain-containing protein n=1 Tax=Anisakis simplex TaxID=6269 RepID=A0A0M3KHI7_ANISI